MGHAVEPPPPAANSNRKAHPGLHSAAGFLRLTVALAVVGRTLGGEPRRYRVVPSRDPSPALEAAAKQGKNAKEKKDGCGPGTSAVVNLALFTSRLLQADAFAQPLRRALGAPRERSPIHSTYRRASSGDLAEVIPPGRARPAPAFSRRSHSSGAIDGQGQPLIGPRTTWRPTNLESTYLVFLVFLARQMLVTLARSIINLGLRQIEPGGEMAPVSKSQSPPRARGMGEQRTPPR